MKSLYFGFMLCLLVHPAWAGTYKCVKPDGGIIFTDTPCFGATQPA